MHVLSVIILFTGTRPNASTHVGPISYQRRLVKFMLSHYWLEYKLFLLKFIIFWKNTIPNDSFRDILGTLRMPNLGSTEGAELLRDVFPQ